MSRFINTDCESDYTAIKVNKKTVTKSTGTYAENRVIPNTDNTTPGNNVSINQYNKPICKKQCKCAKHVQEKINARFSGSERNNNNFIYYDQSALCLFMFIVITFLVRRNTDEDATVADLDPAQASSTHAFKLDPSNSKASGPARDTKMLLLPFRTENKKNSISIFLLNGSICNFRLLRRILQSYWIPERADLLPDQATWVRFSVSCKNLRMCIRSRRG
jgi:hypothetical protein